MAKGAAWCCASARWVRCGSDLMLRGSSQPCSSSSLIGRERVRCAGSRPCSCKPRYTPHVVPPSPENGRRVGPRAGHCRPVPRCFVRSHPNCFYTRGRNFPPQVVNKRHINFRQHRTIRGSSQLTVQLFASFRQQAGDMHKSPTSAACCNQIHDCLLSKNSFRIGLPHETSDVQRAAGSAQSEWCGVA